MKRNLYSTYFLLVWLIGALLIAGCAPVISQGVLAQVDRAIGFEQLLKDPDAYQGRTVLLGGEIIETRNYPENTLIFLLQRPLGPRDEPDVDGESKGRFIVAVPGFLDPAIYRPGRKVTVAGAVEGKQTHPLGEIQYTYPVISRRELYLWPSEETTMTEPRVQFGVGMGIVIQGR
jgi:outer membrane lipoprotein